MAKPKSEEPADEIFATLGAGYWNLSIICVIGSYYFFVPMISLNGVFMAPVVHFECLPSATQDGTQPPHSVGKCDFVLNGTRLDGVTTRRSCTRWSYSEEVFPSTLTAEFNLVCSKRYLRPIYQSTYAFGYLISSISNGFLSDRFGRKSLIWAALCVGATAPFMATFVKNIYAILFFRFLSGISQAPLTHSAFVLALEICDPKHRSVVGVLLSAPWGLGTASYGLMGYLITDWRWLLRATAFPIVISLLLTMWLVDESPRWLIVRGRHKEALRILEKAFRLNGRPLPPKDDLFTQMISIQKLSLLTDESSNPTGCWHTTKEFLKKIFRLIRTPELRKRTILMYTTSISTSTVYFGLAYSAVNFKLNPFLYMGIDGLLEILAYTLPSYVVAKLGRIRPMVASYLICGIVVLSLGFISRELKWVVITFAITGKFFVSAAFQVMYLVLTEAFPTEVRIQGIGSSTFVSRIGVIAAPFITDLLAQKFPLAPTILFGCISLLAALSTALLPETLKVPLPETIKFLEESALSTKQNTRYQQCREDSNELDEALAKDEKRSKLNE